MKKVKVGVIGTSWWTDFVHLASLKSHEKVDLVAICGRNQERAREVAEKYDIRETYADYQQMITKADLDAIVISSPDDLHHPMVIAALERKLHVMCEKPLAVNATQAAEMLRKAKQAQVKHMVFFTYRWYPYLKYYQRLIAEGTVGKCFYFDFHFMKSMNLKNDRGYNWRNDSERSRGVLGDLGSHMIDMCRFCIDEISSVSASLAVHMPVIDPQQLVKPAIDSAILMVETQAGIQGTIHVSRVAAVSVEGTHLSVHGELGELQLQFSPRFGGRIAVDRPGEPSQELKLPDDLVNDLDREMSFIEQMRQFFLKQQVGDRLFIDTILNDLPGQPSFYDGYKAQQVIDAAIESAETGRRIRLD